MKAMKCFCDLMHLLCFYCVHLRCICCFIGIKEALSGWWKLIDFIHSFFINDASVLIEEDFFIIFFVIFWTEKELWTSPRKCLATNILLHPSSNSSIILFEMLTCRCFVQFIDFFGILKIKYHAILLHWNEIDSASNKITRILVYFWVDRVQKRTIYTKTLVCCLPLLQSTYWISNIYWESFLRYRDHRHRPNR